MDITEAIRNRHSEEEFSDQFRMLSDAGASVIHVRTREIMRAVKAVRKCILVDGFVYNEWDIVNGFRRFEISNMFSNTLPGDGNNNILDAFNVPAQRMTASSGGEEQVEYFIYVNPQFFMENNPYLTQMVLFYAHALPSTSLRVVLITPDQALPTGIGDNVTSTYFNTPGIAELRESFASILECVQPNFENGLAFSDEDIDRVCYTGAGMTKDQFDMHTSLSIVEGANSPGRQVNLEHLISGISRGKTEIVNKNDLLELYPLDSMDNVGGMENLKEWVRKRKACFSDNAKAFGVESPKGMVYVGPPGCLAGDTVVQYRRGKRNSGRDITLENLFYKFNGLSHIYAGRGENTPWRDLTVPTYLQSLDEDGYIFYNRIVGITRSGKKEVMELTVSSGETLVLTADHPVCTPGGAFVPVGELAQGSKVLMRGSMLPTSQGGRNLAARPPRKIINVKHHPYGSRKQVGPYSYTRVAYARLVVEAHMNAMAVDEYIHALNHNAGLCQELKYLEPSYEVHHIDEDTLNDDLCNLMVLHKVDHAREHGKVENFNVEHVKEVDVTAIRSVGVRMTYDVQMDYPANNFCANGFIVHNTGKSLSAKAVARELGVPLVRFDFGRVFNSLVGASEERMRTALKMVESMSPCVLFCDEIDKGLGGIMGSGGDSGVSSRVLGTFLTWLQDNTYPVFVMVTANNVEGLPPELLRRGRFDAIFATGLPSDRERREVLRIHLNKRGRNLDNYSEEDIVRVIEASRGYVPAEIEAAVKDALIEAFDQDEELTMMHVVGALNMMKPLSEAFNTQIQAMTLWAKQNAIPAGVVDTPQIEERPRSRVRVPRSTKIN